MSSWDLEVNREVRKELIRHWIDLGKVSIRSTNGRVWVRGSLNRISGIKEDLTSSIVDTLFNDMRRIRGVVALNVEFDNWSNTTGKWQPVEKSHHRAASNTTSRETIAGAPDSGEKK